MMNIFSLSRLSFKSTIFALFLLPSLTGAQYFTNSQVGDVNLGFRKTGTSAENYEMVVYLGNVSNFLSQTAGTTVNVTNYLYQDLTNMCPDNFGNLQWSVFASFSPTQPLVNSTGTWPVGTCWYTVPRSSPGTQTTPINRLTTTDASALEDQILGVSSGASSLSRTLAQEQGNTNVYNNTLVVLEPTADADLDENLTYYISSQSDPSFGNFTGNAIDFTVENVTPTPSSFTNSVVSDFYVNVPSNTREGLVDPLTGSETGTADYLGYFTLSTTGTLTFTRASAVAAPSAGTVTASVTNGFGPLTVEFTDTSSGSITNWVWNFGNGTIITNTADGTVTNTYNVAGSYTVTLTVYGPGGSNSYTVANYIVTSSTPKLGALTMSGGKLIFSGSNCPVGVQYRILSSTNVSTQLANWIPVTTNTFNSSGNFAYTNSIGSTNSFFIMVSP